MIECINLTQFKKFAQTEFVLHPHGLSFLAGGNNSGKSTLLQALAVWEFCRTVLEMERGPESLRTGYTRQGLGLSDDEFSPVEGDEKFLQISLALANDRLFIKAGSTNLGAGDEIPHLTYLPPFAGMAARESRMSGAQRRSMIGRGLAGGVIRNFLYDMHASNEVKRAKLKEGRTKIKGSDLQRLREEDPWELLQNYLGTNFKTQLDVAPFNDLYHSYIRINTIKGEYVGKKFVRFSNFKPRDLMAEGSGFLQMLSVFALALSPDTEVLLLDEPDAHMHPSLQSQLTKQLEEVAEASRKQILLATHSTEILRHADHDKILSFKGASAKYLEKPEQKVGLFLNLRSEYSPKIDPLKKHKRMLIVENLSDERILRAWAKAIGTAWPTNLVSWPWPVGSKERKHLFLQLKTEIPELEAISIIDRDDLSLDQVDLDTLLDKSVGETPGLRLRVWRRRHIENYLLSPAVLARKSGWPIDEITALLAEHALVVPDDFTSKHVAFAMIDARGKQITQEGSRSIKTVLGVRPYDIADAMENLEVCDDARELIGQISELCAA